MFVELMSVRVLLLAGLNANNAELPDVKRERTRIASQSGQAALINDVTVTHSLLQNYEA